jgi:hypothetical protein
MAKRRIKPPMGTSRNARFIPHLPKIFCLVVLLSYPFFFFIIDTEWERLSRFITFFLYAIAVTAIFGGKATLCTRAPDGKPALWLVVSTYAVGCFSITMWGLVILYAAIYYLPTLEETHIMRGVGYALVGGGMVGELMAASVMIWGLRKRERLSYHIHPLPWGAKKDIG